MTALQSIQAAPIRTMLLECVPTKRVELGLLFDDMAPQFYGDEQEDRILFAADSRDNRIILGIKSVVRLNAYSHAAAVMLAGHRRAPGTIDTEIQRLFSPAFPLLRWVYSTELQHIVVRSREDEVALDSVFRSADFNFSQFLTDGLDENQRRLGIFINQYASAFILLHELAHLHTSDVRETGFWSIHQEKEADRRAAEWLLTESIDDNPATGIDRRAALVGIATALLWVTVPTTFLGPHQSGTHPVSYDRLFQVLDSAIDRDADRDNEVWHFVDSLLLAQMYDAGFSFDHEYWQRVTNPRESVSHLIDRISRREFKP